MVLIRALPLAPAYCESSDHLVLSEFSLTRRSSDIAGLQPYFTSVVAVESGPEWDELYAALHLQHLSILGFVRGSWTTLVFPSSSFLLCLLLSDLVVVPYPPVEATLSLAVLCALVICYSQSCRINCRMPTIFLCFCSSMEPFCKYGDNETVFRGSHIAVCKSEGRLLLGRPEAGVGHTRASQNP